MTRHWEVAAAAPRRSLALHAAAAGALADWEEALHGRMSLSEAFANVLRSVGAECGMILRSVAGAPRPHRIALHDERRGEPVRPLVTSFADAQCGPGFERPRPASLWLGTAAPAATGSALAEWQAARRMRDFAVLVLDHSPKGRDHAELHFRHELPAEAHLSLGAMLAAMARGWAMRHPGGAVERAIASQCKRTEPRGVRPILGPANPTQLSRAEFRVCLLLSRGLAVEGVAAELGLAKSTVRAHLRSIYAKTGTASLPELVFSLLDSRQTEGDHDRPAA